MADRQGTPGVTEPDDCSCQHCGKINDVMKRCIRCRRVFYCSRECQAKAWPFHKRICGVSMETGNSNDIHSTASAVETQAPPYTKPETTNPANSVVHKENTNKRDSASSRRSHRHDIFGDSVVDDDDEVAAAASVYFDHTAPIRKSGVITVKTTVLPPKEEPVPSWKSFSEEEDMTPRRGQSLLNMSAALQSVRKAQESASIEVAKPQGRKYMMSNVFHFDAPALDESEPKCDVTIRANKDKITVSLQRSWTGLEIFKVISSESRIPLDKMKVIHKGKVLTPDSMAEKIQPRAVFQLIGEQGLSEDGLDSTDIELMMHQLGIGRNEAVASLRKNGTVLDAMLNAVNKL